jgi:hypothetical protein
MSWKKDANGWYNNKVNKKGKIYTDFWITLAKQKPVQTWDKGDYIVEKGGWNIKTGFRRKYARKRFNTQSKALEEIRKFKKLHK